MSEVVAAPVQAVVAPAVAVSEAVQVPTPQPSRYKNEGRDVLGDALKNEHTQAIDPTSGNRFIPVQESAQEVQQDATPVTPVVEVPVDPSKAPETVTPVTPAERLYAGEVQDSRGC